MAHKLVVHSDVRYLKDPLVRARRLLDRARDYETAGARERAARCRRYAFALITCYGIATDGDRIPNVLVLERMLAAYEAGRRESAAA